MLLTCEPGHNPGCGAPSSTAAMCETYFLFSGSEFSPRGAWIGHRSIRWDAMSGSSTTGTSPKIPSTWLGN